LLTVARDDGTKVRRLSGTSYLNVAAKSGDPSMEIAPNGASEVAGPTAALASSLISNDMEKENGSRSNNMPLLDTPRECLSMTIVTSVSKCVNFVESKKLIIASLKIT
jgi:hypothetical protein